MNPEARILLAEDDPCLARLLILALERLGPETTIIQVPDGQDALDCLYARGEFLDGPMDPPALVLLDLEMPRVDGLEVLRRIKNDERLRVTPVVMLTSSECDRDVQACYRAGANAYVVKPGAFEDFMSVIQQVGLFWTRINRPPPPVAGPPAGNRGNTALIS